MKRILLAMLLAALLIGCSAKKAPEAPEEPKVVVEEDAPTSFTLTLVTMSNKPLLGEGRIEQSKFVPDALEIQKGDILRVENRDVNYETVQIIQVKKDYKQSKFRTLLKEDLAKGEVIEYSFSEEGLYKVKCLFSGCISTVAVA